MDPKKFMEELAAHIKIAVGQAVTQAASAVFDKRAQEVQHQQAAYQQHNGRVHGQVVVIRRKNNGDEVQVTTSVPQLLAEQCDLLKDIRYELSRRRR